MLAARRGVFVRTSVLMCLGIAGTGGASGALGTGCSLDGEDSLKVLSLIEAELARRSSDGRPPAEPVAELATEEVEPALRRVLLVCTSATDVGVVGRALRAAAAAAEERAALEVWLERKACAAAVAAEALAFDGG